MSSTLSVAQAKDLGFRFILPPSLPFLSSLSPSLHLFLPPTSVPPANLFQTYPASTFHQLYCFIVVQVTVICSFYYFNDHLTVFPGPTLVITHCLFSTQQPDVSGHVAVIQNKSLSPPRPYVIWSSCFSSTTVAFLLLPGCTEPKVLPSFLVSVYSLPSLLKEAFPYYLIWHNLPSYSLTLLGIST